MPQTVAPDPAHPTLPASPPSEQGVDARGVTAFLDAVEQLPDVQLHGLVVVRHGHVVARGAWAPYRVDTVGRVYSVSKAFTTTALGLAVAEGLLGLDDRVLSHLPELDAEVTDPRSRALTLRHLGSMAAGHLTDALDPALAVDPTDLVRGFLRLPPEREPGTHFAYSQPCTYTLATVLQRVTGQRLVDYLRPRLLDPLGVGPVAWQQDPPGRDVGYSGLHTGADAVASLAQLYLQRGRWEQQQLLPGAWVEEASRVQVGTPDEDDPDWRLGYGLQLWRSRHGYRADGAYGQLGLVLPQQDAVVALTSECASVQPLLEAVWEHLLPALSDGAQGAGDADAELVRRLAGLRLPEVDAGPGPADPARWDGARLPAAPGSSPETPAPTSVRVRRADGRWELSLAHGEQVLVAPLAGAGWLTDDAPVTDPDGGEVARVPVATSGGWTADGDLAVDVAFLQTPHRLRLHARAGADEVDVRWVSAPLWAPQLSDLAAPGDLTP
ncbi:serine hydrolase domain-containing protein [Jannaschia sp. R86511]|uniref:serine hydrolase domain-containing protein n=1 Tax=Jannaschia sp. R86511 TaxID=3093853 RepID=UPI0036D29C7B